MPTVGFLHTEPGHVALAARAVRERAPWLVDVHLVDETLLAHLRAVGLDDDLRRRLGARVGELVGRAVDAVVCTCTVVGEEVVRLSTEELPVFGPEQLTGSAPLALR